MTDNARLNTARAMDRYRSALYDVLRMCSLDAYNSIGPIVALEQIEARVKEALPPHNDPKKVSEHYGRLEEKP